MLVRSGVCAQAGYTKGYPAEGCCVFCGSLRKRDKSALQGEEAPLADQGLLAGHTEGKRVGIIGGTFDPIHYAHLACAEEVYRTLKLAQIIFVPAGEPPHKMGMPVTPAQHRLAMLQLAITENPHFTLSLADLQRPGPSYTVDTLRLLKQELGQQSELYFIIGGDSLKDLPSWYNPGGIIEQASIVALMRPGYMNVQQARQQVEGRLPGLNQRLITLVGPQMEISSTDLRQRVSEGRPIRYQTPDAVERYIFQQHLYQGPRATGQPEKTVEQREGGAHAANAI